MVKVLLLLRTFAFAVQSYKMNRIYVVNDRNDLKLDSAETEASARSTEASTEASAESLAEKYTKFFKNRYSRKVPY